MKIIVFDTETTGLPPRDTSIRETTKWPHIVQLSYLLYDTENNATIDCIDQIIRLDPSVKLPKESVRIHGITRSRMNCRGGDIKDALEQFVKFAQDANVLVGHNLRFDKKMLMVEGIRHNCKMPFDSMREYCTMEKSIDLCKIERTNKQGKKYFKYPNLSELHTCLFGNIPNGTHDSMADVLITLRCFMKMKHKSELTCKFIQKLFNIYEIDR